MLIIQVKEINRKTLSEKLSRKNLIISHFMPTHQVAALGT